MFTFGGLGFGGGSAPAPAAAAFLVASQFIDVTCLGTGLTSAQLTAGQAFDCAWVGSKTAATVQAPSFVGSPTYTVGASGNTRTFDYSAYVLRPGDTLWAACLSRAASVINTTTPPANEGWVLEWSFRISGMTLDIYRKRWGDGDTDPSRQTSAFSFATGGNTLSVGGAVVRGAKRVGSPVSQVSAVPGSTTAAAATITSATVASPVAATTMTLSFFATVDDNTLNAPSRGTLAFSGNLTSANGCSAMVYEAGVDSSSVTCTVAESTQGTDAYIAATIVIDGELPDTSGITLAQFASDADGKSRTNSTGWTEGFVTDVLARSGYIYSSAYWVTDAKKVEIRILREPVTGGPRVLVDSYTSPVIADPAGIGNWPSDPHFTPTGTFSKTGKFQIWLLAHGTESLMQFGKASAIGSAAVTLADWSWTTDASYPAAAQMGDGTAVLCHRIGAPGATGWQELWEENPAENGWTKVVAKIMQHSNGTSTPYMNRVTVDPVRDWLHASWCWADGNTSLSYHGVHYVRLVRTAALTWVGKDVAGNTVTLPVNESTTNCVVDSTTTAQPVCVHNGGSFDPATGLPLLTYLMASTTSHGGGTDLWAAHWNVSSWSRIKVRQIHPFWDMIGAPPNPERAVVRGPDRLPWKGLQYITYTSDIELGSSGVSCLRAQSSSDGGATWSAPFTLVDQKFYGSCPRFDMARLTKLGRLAYLLAEQCDDDDAVFLENVLGNIAIIDVDALPTPPPLRAVQSLDVACVGTARGPLLATQAFDVQTLASSPSTAPLIASQGFTAEAVSTKLAAPQLRIKPATAAITLGGTMRASGTSPPVVLLAASSGGSLTFAANCPGIKVEIDSVAGGTARGQATFRVSYDSGVTWALSGQTTAATFDLGGTATGVQLQFPVGTYGTTQNWEGTVETLKSSEGSAYTFTQATVATQPVFRDAASTPDGKDALFFTGAQWLASTDAGPLALFTNDPALTVISRIAYTTVDAGEYYLAACSSATSTARSRLFGHGTAGAGRELTGSVTNSSVTVTNTCATDPLTGGTAAHNVCWRFPGSGGSVNISVNDAAESLDITTLNAGTTTPTRVALGAWADATPGQFHNGYIYEIAVFSSNLSAALQTGWHNALAAG